jgi:HPt (histidine-containing phosphotransfer) domain-containing protein
MPAKAEKAAYMEPNSHTGGESSFAVWDRAAALDRVGGDDSLLQELMGMLFEQIDQGLPRLSRALEQENAHDLEHTAHSLKGAAASLGADRFRQCAYEIEQMGRSGELARAAAALSRLQEEANALRAEACR